MAEAEAYQWEDGSPGVRYSREKVAPVTRAHTSTHTHTHTHLEDYTSGRQHSHPPPSLGSQLRTEREQTQQLVRHHSYK